MRLNVEAWKPFKINEIFEVKYGINMELNACTIADDDDDDAVNFVARTESNNGVSAKAKPVDGKDPQPAGIITCAGGGSVLSTFLQEEPFYSGRDLYLLIPLQPMSKLAKLFCITVIKANKYRYSYGRQANVTLPFLELMLPVDSEGNPDFLYMEAYMKTLNHKPLATSNQGGCGSRTLGVESWKEFVVGDYFEVKKGKRLTSEDQTEGNTLYIGAIDSNNGVANKIGQEPIHEGNTISLSYNGSVGEAFYQPEPFWATDDVNVLYFRPENGGQFNKYIALFVCAVLRQEKYRYSYGRKWVLENMKTTVIKLPAKGEKPDWAFMESYMKSLPYGDRI